MMKRFVVGFLLLLLIGGVGLTEVQTKKKERELDQKWQALAKERADLEGSDMSVFITTEHLTWNQSKYMELIDRGGNQVKEGELPQLSLFAVSFTTVEQYYPIVYRSNNKVVYRFLIDLPTFDDVVTQGNKERCNEYVDAGLNAVVCEF